MRYQTLQKDYTSQFSEIVSLISSVRNKVYNVANRALIDLYWNIGKYISDRIENAEWGDSVVDQLSQFIIIHIPNAKGFSNKNLWRMKQFYQTYPNPQEKLSSLMREISWTNNLKIISRCKTPEEREFYITLSAKENLSSRELDRQITSCLFERTLVQRPKLSSLMREIVPEADKVFRDQYIIEFLGASLYPTEQTLKKAIIAKMKDFILEVGKDFIFMGEEYRIHVGMEDFRIDLLFYHRGRQCLVAFELKLGSFKPAHLGQLEFYLEALDRNVKKENENPSIGILLCKDKDNEVVEYALARTLSPAMVSEYKLKLPDKTMLRKKMQELFTEETDSTNSD